MRYALLSEGSSDQALLPILDWLLGQYMPEESFGGEWIDPHRLGPVANMADQIQATMDLYDYDLIFRHRDADKETPEKRRTEIREAVEQSGVSVTHICVIPVREMEAWLLFSEEALREAAGNPSGKEILKLPAKKSIESLTDPKKTLYELLKKASPRKPAFSIGAMVARIPQAIKDFSPLRGLPAFDALETDIQSFADAYEGAASGTE